MDPSAPDKKKKDGDWNFPPEVEFPVDARVLLKFYKVVGMGETSDEGKGVQTKYINTKVMKVETSLNQEDLYTKSWFRVYLILINLTLLIHVHLFEKELICSIINDILNVVDLSVFNV